MQEKTDDAAGISKIEVARCIIQSSWWVELTQRTCPSHELPKGGQRATRGRLLHDELASVLACSRSVSFNVTVNVFVKVAKHLLIFDLHYCCPSLTAINWHRRGMLRAAEPR